MRENVKFMNIYLQGQFPDWTHERNKNKRKRPEYRALVQEIMDDEAARSRDPPSPSAQGPQATEGEAAASLRAWIEGVIPKLASERKFYAATLATICQDALEGKDCAGSLSEWMKAVFPQRARAKRYIPDRKNRGSSPCRSRKLAKRMEFARTQRLFSNNPARAARLVLDGETKEPRLHRKAFVGFWSDLMTTESIPKEGAAITTAATGRDGDLLVNLDQIMNEPVTNEEVANHRLKRYSAPGPDQITGRQWFAVPPTIRAALFNVILLEGSVPQTLFLSRTIFIPKVKDPARPEDY
jgi:hypothetical protein